MRVAAHGTVTSAHAFATWQRRHTKSPGTPHLFLSGNQPGRVVQLTPCAEVS